MNGHPNWPVIGLIVVWIPVGLSVCVLLDRLSAWMRPGLTRFGERIGLWIGERLPLPVARWIVKRAQR